MTTHLRRRRVLPGLLLALATTAALAACSAGSDDAAGGPATAPELASPEAADADGGTAAGSDSASAPEATARGRTGVSLARDVISTGTVSLTSGDVATARRAVQRVVDEEGGVISDEDTETDEDGVMSYACMVVRVPSGRFDAAMSGLEKAASLRASNKSAEDVTSQVIDTKARVRAQQASLRRVERLLAEARSMQQVIAIESQLTSRQAELDSLKQQQAYLADQTELATITVDIEQPPAKPTSKEKKPEPAGFLVGLRGGTDALAAAGIALATVVGALLPWAITLAVLAAPVWLVLRRTRRGSVSADAG